MAGSTFGTLFRMTTWGETHGKGVGVVVDGCPAGLSLCEEDVQKYLNRRKPGQSDFSIITMVYSMVADSTSLEYRYLVLYVSQHTQQSQ